MGGGFLPLPLPPVTPATLARDSDQFSQKSTQSFPLTQQTQSGLCKRDMFWHSLDAIRNNIMARL